MKGAVALALLFVAVICQGVSIHIKQSDSFDFFIFVQEWDPNITSQYFTIHGCWPQDTNGQYPSFCSGEEFSTSAISDLIPTMDQVWPSDTGNNTGFWSHEWEKHGTCSGYSLHDFFQTVISLQSKYNVLSALAQSNINPGRNNEYSKDDVVNAIKSNIGGVPSLNCNNTALAEMGVCLTKSLGVMDCPDNMGDFWNCPDKFYFNNY